MNKDFERVLIKKDEIESIVKHLSDQITKDYKDSDSKLLLLGILKGSVVFLGDLMKHIGLPVEIDFMKVSSYGGSTVSSGKAKILLDIQRNDLQDLDILIVEDIIDSGKTLSYLTEHLKRKGAKSVKTVTFLDKPERREVEFTPDYVGKKIPDMFIVGYGLDYNEKYRAIPDICVLKPEIYK